MAASSAAAGEASGRARVEEPGAPFVEPVGRPWGRIVVAGALVAVFVVAVFVVDPADVSVARLQAWVEETGVWAPLVYVVGFVVGAVVVVPGTAMMVVAALLFPLPWALALAWSGSVLGGTVCFLLARVLGRGFVARVLGERLATLDERVAERGFQVVLLSRLAGVPPFNMLNYLAGLTRVRLRDYVGGTAVGVTPLVVAVVVIVNRIGTAPSARDVLTDPVLYAAMVLVVVVLWVASRLKRRARVLVEG